MGIALLLSLIALAAVLLLRYRRGRALSQAASQLKEARNQPGKRLRLAAPDRPVEELLAQINGLLEDRETETRQLREREESLRAGRSPMFPTTCAPLSPPFWAISSCWKAI